MSHTGDFKVIVDGLIKGLPELEVTDAFRPITVNGTKGFQVTYTYDSQGTQGGAMSYLAAQGPLRLLDHRSGERRHLGASWSKLAPAMASFTIVPVKS